MAIYTIWDTETANLVDAYPTEEEALADVRDAVEQFGRSYAASWGLSRKESNGALIAIADGEELVDRAFGVAPAKRPPA
jgi:hypothetical protein